MMLTILGAATASVWMMRIIDRIDDPKKGAKNRPSAGTLKRFNVTRQAHEGYNH